MEKSCGPIPGGLILTPYVPSMETSCHGTHGPMQRIIWPEEKIERTALQSIWPSLCISLQLKRANQVLFLHANPVPGGLLRIPDVRQAKQSELASLTRSSCNSKNIHEIASPFFCLFLASNGGHKTADASREPRVLVEFTSLLWADRHLDGFSRAGPLPAKPRASSDSSRRRKKPFGRGDRKTGAPWRLGKWNQRRENLRFALAL